MLFCDVQMARAENCERGGTERKDKRVGAVDVGGKRRESGPREPWRVVGSVTREAFGGYVMFLVSHCIY